MNAAKSVRKYLFIKALLAYVWFKIQIYISDTFLLITKSHKCDGVIKVKNLHAKYPDGEGRRVKHMITDAPLHMFNVLRQTAAEDSFIFPLANLERISCISCCYYIWKVTCCSKCRRCSRNNQPQPGVNSVVLLRMWVQESNNFSTVELQVSSTPCCRRCGTVFAPLLPQKCDSVHIAATTGARPYSHASGAEVTLFSHPFCHRGEALLTPLLPQGWVPLLPPLLPQGWGRADTSAATGVMPSSSTRARPPQSEGRGPKPCVNVLIWSVQQSITGAPSEALESAGVSASNPDSKRVPWGCIEEADGLLRRTSHPQRPVVLGQKFGEILRTICAPRRRRIFSFISRLDPSPQADVLRDS